MIICYMIIIYYIYIYKLQVVQIKHDTSTPHQVHVPPACCHLLPLESHGKSQIL